MTETQESTYDVDQMGPSFTDWASFVSFKPQLYFRPQDQAGLKSFLQAVYQGVFPQKVVRVLGGLHSCSEICVADGIIDTSDLPRTMEFGPGNATVTVSANWHLHDFLAALSARGKSISATGGTDEQTLAGLISTNTAPATPQTALYELVNWVEYLTIDEASGMAVEKHIERGGPDFAAVIGSLGAVGILTRVQFRLVDELFFETVQKIVKVKDILSDLALTSRTYDFWRVDWIPDTDEGLLWAAKRVPSAKADGDYPIDQSENILQFIFKVLDRIESAGPKLDFAMRVVYEGLELAYGVTKVSGPLRNMLPVDRRAPLQVAMAEWSFAPNDLDRLMAACREYFGKSGWPNLPIEIELTKTDDYMMSAWNWPGLDYIVKFNFMYLTDVSGTKPEKAEIMAHLHGLWDFLIAKGIPFKAHWGKINFMDPPFVQSRYQLDRFKPYIRKMFVNPYLAERLGL
jgi:hypothetical protein